MRTTGFAPAKINLFLHILSRRPDGYHTLESLVTFADCGDRLALDCSQQLSLAISGPFAAACGSPEGNLVLKAARALLRHVPGLRCGAFSLEKNLPVSSGIGGGSADAAAALRLLAETNDLAFEDERIKAAALETGADVPVCLNSNTALMRGVGDEVMSVTFPKLAAVLVNPGAIVSTRDVFTVFKRDEKEAKDFSSLPANPDDIFKWLDGTANDLAATARDLCPQISLAEKALQQTDARLVRMSGSGATVFGLYGDATSAAQAAADLQENHPGWWIRASMLG